MSGTATIAITVGVAVAVLVGFFIVYYLGNVANSIYDVKVGVRKDFDKKVKELQDWIEKDTKQRISWMRDENKAEGKRFKESVEGHLEETFNELEKTVERLRADVTSLQVQVQNLQKGNGTKPSPVRPMSNPYRQPAPDMMAGMGGSSGGFGDVEVPRMGLPQGDVAPDMAAAIKKDETSEEGEAPKAPGAIRDKPTPPPPPKQRAVSSAVTTKAEKPKKKRRTDEFESFDQFSGEFKAGK